MIANLQSPWLPIDTDWTRSSAPTDDWILERLEAIPKGLSSDLLALGLEPATLHMVHQASNLFKLAIGVISRLPDLHQVVKDVVGQVHALKAVSGYDVSHSEPRWRTTVFVSIPERRDIVGALRLAESIVHEAMHLLLTSWETIGSFVAEPDVMLQSPWRGTQRPVQGVLHGTFVFVCIRTFFSRLASAGLGASAVDHLTRRLNQISEELSAVDLLRLRSALTPRGAAYLHEWTLVEGA